ncbi:hypothetical protein F5B17DRAFT_363894 [Nemania serpens]|nr:hypothetical protein F5B17DRAFT_363894 [Nemania serpens]
MDATVVLAWLTDVGSSLPSPSFGPPPSPSPSLPRPSSRVYYQRRRSSLRSGATGSSRTRSQSPIIQTNDLIMLDVPVYWRDVSGADLSRRLDERKSVGLLQSINSVLKKGYLPEELREILDLELAPDDRDDMLYSATPSIPFSDSQLRRARYLASTGLLPGSEAIAHL